MPHTAAEKNTTGNEERARRNDKMIYLGAPSIGEVCVQQLTPNRSQLTYFLHLVGAIKSGFYCLLGLSPLLVKSVCWC